MEQYFTKRTICNCRNKLIILHGMTKVCRRCKKELPTSLFIKHPSKKDGLMDDCTPCHRPSVIFEKECTNCKKVLPVSSFHPHHMTKDGYKHQCKTCIHGEMKSNKICRICKQKLPLSSFHKHKKTKDGLRHECAECRVQEVLIYRGNHREKYLESRRLYKLRKSQKVEEMTCENVQLHEDDLYYLSVRLLKSVKSRVTKYRLHYDLDLIWVMEKLRHYKCEATGIGLSNKKDGSRIPPLAPSIDRIDNAKGYTKDNCRIVCWWYNITKADWSDDLVLEMITSFYENKIKNN